MNWMDCPVIEQVPGRLSGVPVIRNTRVRPEDVIINRDEGEDWLVREFRLPVIAVRQVLAFYAEHATQLAPAV